MTIYQEIQHAIDIAWSTDDPTTKQRQIELVGETQKPTPEDVIFSIAAKILAENT